MVGLGDLPGGSFYSGASGVSADGSVVVGNSYPASGYLDAFRWTAGGDMVALGDGGESQEWANAVSADGSVVVGVFEIDGDEPGREAFRWTVDEMVGLSGLPVGGLMNYANGVSGDGSVVVGTSGSEAFRWTAGEGMVGLGFPPGGSIATGALGVSADGSVIVGVSRLASDSDDVEAVRWTAGDGMQRLWDLLLAQGVEPAAGGWSSLTEATAVSADGNTIVGYGTRNGNTEAFRVVLPSLPCSAFVPPDLDHDCDVDAQDVAAFRACALRASVPVSAACHSSDFDGDGDADMSDFGILQRCYENAVPTCVN
jgi:probable HAF family extracellular repeat protein